MTELRSREEQVMGSLQYLGYSWYPFEVLEVLLVLALLAVQVVWTVRKWQDKTVPNKFVVLALAAGLPLLPIIGVALLGHSSFNSSPTYVFGFLWLCNVCAAIGFVGTY